MKETRKLKIKNKVFNKKDIENIGNILLGEYTKSNDEHNYYKISFKVICDDDTVYESESMNLLEDGNILDLKKVDTIELSFNEHILNRSINFSVSSDNYGYNYISVTGNDSYWVNGIFNRLKEIIDSVEPQSDWFLDHKRVIYHISALGVGNVFFLLKYSNNSNSKPFRNSWSNP